MTSLINTAAVKVWGCIMLILPALPASWNHVRAQELVTYPFSESILAGQMEVQHANIRGPNSNPLLDAYDVKFYGLDVQADIVSDRISGHVTVLAETLENGFSTLVLELIHSLEVDRVLIEGTQENFTHTGDELYIDLTAQRDSGALLSAQIFYSGQTGPGMVREVDEEWGVAVTYTSSEPFYSRDWFPCKQDLGDKADSVHVFITTDYGLMGVSNGIHTATSYFLDGKVRYEWKSNYPIDYYLISIAVADYVEYNFEVQPGSISHPILVQNFLYDVPGCLDTYRDQIHMTDPMMEVFCQHFGPYPHREEKYGHYLWPRGGGMEHQTMTGMGHFEFYLVAHELGHSWFGNYVTCATWQDIWINEGFATFAGYLATEILAPAYADGEREYRFNRALREPEGSVYIPEEDADDASRIFSGNLSYNKGMAILYMLRYEMQDDEMFYLTLRNFLDRYANDVATGMDFKEVLEETTGRDYTDFFDQWYFGAGYPIYDVSWEQVGNQLNLVSTQSTSSTQTALFKMDMEYTLYHAGGDTTIRIFQDEQVEDLLFQVPFTVTDIGIDTRNRVLDGQHVETKQIKAESGSPLFRVAPNPNKGAFHFSLDRDADMEKGEGVLVEIVDLAGRALYRKLYRDVQPFMDYAVELEEHVKGICLVRFSCSNKIEVQKILVE